MREITGSSDCYKGSNAPKHSFLYEFETNSSTHHSDGTGQHMRLFSNAIANHFVECIMSTHIFVHDQKLAFFRKKSSAMNTTG